MIGTTLAAGMAVIYAHAIGYDNKVKDIKAMALYKNVAACEEVVDSPSVQAKLFDAVASMEDVKKLELFCLELPKTPTSSVNRGL